MPEPTTITSLDQAFRHEGVFILFVAPPAEFQGVATRAVGIIGEFERGPVSAVTKVTNLQTLVNTFGSTLTSANFDGMKQISGGKWGGDLFVIRVNATGAAVAERDFLETATPVVNIAALSQGAHGNQLRIDVVVGALGATTRTYTITDLTDGRQEVYENIDEETVPVALSNRYPENGVSLLVNFTKVADGNADVIASQALDDTAGADGTSVSGDWTGLDGIPLFESTSAKNVSIVTYGTPPAGAEAALQAQMKTSAENVGRWIGCISAADNTQAVAAAVTDVDVNRSDFLAYFYGFTNVFISGLEGKFEILPHTMGAAAMSQTPVHWDITSDAGAVGSSRAVELLQDVDIGDFQTLRDAGVVHFENDTVLGIHAAASVLTTAFTSKRDINFQRTAQFIGRSIAEGLRPFQGKPRSELRVNEVIDAADGFLGTIVDNGTNDDPMLVAFSVKTEGVVSPQEEAKGLFVLLIEAQQLPTMRHMVVKLVLGTNIQISVEAA